MTVHLTSDEVWAEVEANNFGVVGIVTASAEARTVGILYIVENRKLYIGADASAWKTRHIERNPHVSMTIPIARRVPFLPWIKVPASTITFSGTAQVLTKEALGPELTARLYRHETGRDEWCAIEVTPEKDFITYGVGISVLRMRFPEKSRARVPVEPAAVTSSI